MYKMFVMALALLTVISSVCNAAVCNGQIFQSDINSDCRVNLSDFAMLGQNWLKTGSAGNAQVVVKYDQAIRLEAENAELFWESSDGGTIRNEGTWVRILNGPGAGNTTGKGYVKFDNAIPDGTYLVKMRINSGVCYNWAGAMAVKVTAVGTATYSEQGGGGVSLNDGWHSFEPEPRHGTTDETWYDGWYASAQGSDGWYCPVTYNSLPNSITVGGIDGVNGKLQVGITDNVYFNYAYQGIDYVELIPVVTTGGPLHIEAEVCPVVSSGDENFQLNGTDAGATICVRDGKTGVMVIGGGTATNNATGIATISIPVAIPDGDYEMRMSMRTGATHIKDMGSWAVKISADNGTVYETGLPNQGDWHIFYPASDQGVLSDHWYTTSWIDSGWYAPVFELSPMPESLHLENIDANDLKIVIGDGIFDNYDQMFIDYIEFVDVNNLAGDIDNSKQIDFNDVQIMATQWLFCNDSADPQCTDVVCSSMPALGIMEYFATAFTGSVTLDGNLSEWPAFDYTSEYWCSSKWIPVGKQYDGTPYAENAYMCLMYSVSEDVVYGAVIVDDYSPYYQSYFDWNAQDDIEIYIRGDVDNKTPADPITSNFANAQQYLAGLSDDLSTCWAVWPDGTAAGSNVQLGVGRTAIDGGEHVVYEFKVTPYENYAEKGGSGSTIQSQLTSGKQLGFDLVIMDRTEGLGYGMLCPNMLAGKSSNVANYGILTLK